MSAIGRPFLDSLVTLDQALAGAGETVFAFDRELRYVFWGAGMERMFGLTAGAVLGRVALDLFPFLSETGDDERLRAALRGEAGASHGQRYAVPETGRQGWIDAHYAPIREGDQTVGGIGVVREVTDERQREALELDARFRHMADCSPVMLWMAGDDARCDFFNQTWLDFTGRPLEAELGVGWAEGVHPEDLARCLDVYMAAFGRRERFEMDYRLRRADGEFRWILDRGAPRYLPDGTFAGYVGSCVDITERKALEASLHQALRARDDFLSIAAHELRTPLTSVTLQVEQLVRQARKLGAPVDPIRPRIDSLQRNVARHSQLLEDLLDLSRITSGPVKLALTQMDLVEIVRGVLGQFTEPARVAGVELHAELPGSIVGMWDAGRMEQVVRNLISNAVKYGDRKPVDVKLRQDGDHVRLEVRDHGIGISEQEQRQLFERFERAPSATGYSGFGLGLWITRQVLAAMGGTIDVESAPGQGAAFRVDLPHVP